MLQAIGAERAVLSIILNAPDVMYEIDDIVSSDDFTNSGNRVIFGLIRDFIISEPGQKVDYHTILSLAEQKGIKNFLSVTENGQLLDALFQSNVNPDTIGRHVSAVKAATVKRSSINFLENLKGDIEKFQGDAALIANMVEDAVISVVRSFDVGDEEIQKIEDGFEETINTFADTDGLAGLDVGLPRWQRDCGGMINGTVTGLFARAKAGKSQFSAHCAVQAAINQNLPVLYLDTELQLRMQQMRVCSIISGIPYEEVKSGAWKADRAKVEKIKDAFAKVKNSPFFYKNIAGRSYKYVIPVIRKWFHKNIRLSEGDMPKCLVIYDYIKLMDMGDLKKAQEYQVLGFLLSAIHDVAAQLNIPILCLGQLNREALKVDNEASVAGSDRITHNLDSLTIMRPKKEEEVETDGEKRGNYMLKALLARSGPGHDYNEWINLHFDKGAGQFKEDKRNSEVMSEMQGSRPIRERLEDMETGPFGEMRED